MNLDLPTAKLGHMLHEHARSARDAALQGDSDEVIGAVESAMKIGAQILDHFELDKWQLCSAGPACTALGLSCAEVPS